MAYNNVITAAMREMISPTRMAPAEPAGFVMPPPTEAEKRDAALHLLEQTRARLVVVAKAMALEIVKAYGVVTSVDVLRCMREHGHGPDMDLVDSRWAGCIFRKGWQRDGYEPTGSHCRPVARWKLKS